MKSIGPPSAAGPRLTYICRGIGAKSFLDFGVPSPVVLQSPDGTSSDPADNAKFVVEIFLMSGGELKSSQSNMENKQSFFGQDKNVSVRLLMPAGREKSQQS